MKNVTLKDLVGGALQEKFSGSFERVLTNLLDPNTPYKNKRKIQITLSFTQNELRNDVNVDIDVIEKLSPQTPMKTQFSIGKDLRTGEIFAEEYGNQIRGQMSIHDYETATVDGKTVDVETGEIKDTAFITEGIDIYDADTGEKMDNVVELNARQA